MLLLDEASEFEAVRLALAGYIALVGYQVAITIGSTRARAITYAAMVPKNILAGH